MNTPYKARSLAGAQRRVRELQKSSAKAHELMSLFHEHRVLLAKLAADGPCFSNPLHVAAAKKVRDEILLRYCKLLPDGKFAK